MQASAHTTPYQQAYTVTLFMEESTCSPQLCDREAAINFLRDPERPRAIQVRDSLAKCLALCKVPFERLSRAHGCDCLLYKGCAAWIGQALGNTGAGHNCEDRLTPKVSSLPARKPHTKVSITEGHFADIHPSAFHRGHDAEDTGTCHGVL